MLFLFFKNTPILAKSSVQSTITCELKSQHTTPQDSNSTLVFEDNEEDEDFNCKKDYQLIKSTFIGTGDYFLFYQIYGSKALCLIAKTSYLQKINLRLCHCIFRI